MFCINFFYFMFMSIFQIFISNIFYGNFYWKTYIILIRRSYDLKIHAGEIAFPGGKYEKQDGDLFETARREMREELNIWVEESLVIARLPSVTTFTGFKLTPFVAFVDHQPRYDPNCTEVNEVLDIPLVPLLASQTPRPGLKTSMSMIDFRYGEDRIWGATAKILHQLGRLKTY